MPSLIFWYSTDALSSFYLSDYKIKWVAAPKMDVCIYLGPFPNRKMETPNVYQPIRFIGLCSKNVLLPYLETQVKS